MLSCSGLYSLLTKRMSSEKSMTMNLHGTPRYATAPSSSSAVSSVVKLFEGPRSPSPSEVISSTSLSLSTAFRGTATSRPPCRLMIGSPKEGLLSPKGATASGTSITSSVGSPSVDHLRLCFSISPMGGWGCKEPHKRSAVQ